MNKGLPVNNRESPTDWVEFYRAALIETNKAKLRDRIEKAQKVLHQRATELVGEGNGFTDERQAIADALKALHSLLELYALQ